MSFSLWHVCCGSLTSLYSQISNEPVIWIVVSLDVLWVCAQSCPSLWDPMDHSLPWSYVFGIFQARIMEWIAMPFSRGSSRPRIKPMVLTSPGISRPGSKCAAWQMHALTSPQSSVHLYVVGRVQLHSVLVFHTGTSSVLACVIFYLFLYRMQHIRLS